MKKYIHVTGKVRDKLMKMFGVTRQSVWRALNFERDTDLARKIRKAAYENYGILMVSLPAMETFHDSDGYIRKYFPNDAMLEISMADSSADVFMRGKKVKHYDVIMRSDIVEIQNQVAAM